MTNLSDFVPDLPCDTAPTNEWRVALKKKCAYKDLIELALQNRKTHPNDTLEWELDGKDTYTLYVIVKPKKSKEYTESTYQPKEQEGI